jgi:hypothetical protein
VLAVAVTEPIVYRTEQEHLEFGCHPAPTCVRSFEDILQEMKDESRDESAPGSPNAAA